MGDPARGDAGDRGGLGGSLGEIIPQAPKRQSSQIMLGVAAILLVMLLLGAVLWLCNYRRNPRRSKVRKYRFNSEEGSGSFEVGVGVGGDGGGGRVGGGVVGGVGVGGGMDAAREGLQPMALPGAPYSYSGRVRGAGSGAVTGAAVYAAYAGAGTGTGGYAYAGAGSLTGQGVGGGGGYVGRTPASDPHSSQEEALKARLLADA
ncbi:hypothetical protein B484DRAFT_269730 [Ochromonadaceae sp. CCMP2298]|nr:hypothetical protein B484DRAFT_269730 [Ochromonadaceae sp. CCMP2298]